MSKLAKDYDAKLINFNEPEAFNANQEGQKVEDFSLKPFVVRQGKDIPKRNWLYGSSYLGGTVTGTIAPGGVGKSVLTLSECICMAAMPDDGQTKHSLLGKWTRRGLRVVYLNLEDDHTEQERRAAAFIDTHGIDRTELSKRLFIPQNEAFGLTLAEMDSGRAVLCDDVSKLEFMIHDHSIDVVVIDPFVSAHSLSENDNAAVDKAVKALGRIARQTGACIHLVHHVAKLRGETLTQDSARGASAFVDGLRLVRGVVRMTKKEADEAGLEGPEGYIRTEGMKSNYAKPENADWYHLESHDLDNGESVGVPVQWTFPDALSQFTPEQARDCILAVQAAQPVRASDRSHGEWIGTIIGDVMGWDVPDGKILKKNYSPEQAQGIAQVRRAIKTWEDNGVIEKGDMKDPNPKKSGDTVKSYSVNAEKIPCTPA